MSKTIQKNKITVCRFFSTAESEPRYEIYRGLVETFCNMRREEIEDLSELLIAMLKEESDGAD